MISDQQNLPEVVDQKDMEKRMQELETSWNNQELSTSKKKKNKKKNTANSSQKQEENNAKDSVKDIEFDSEQKVESVNISDINQEQAKSSKKKKKKSSQNQSTINDESSKTADIQLKTTQKQDNEPTPNEQKDTQKIVASNAGKSSTKAVPAKSKNQKATPKSKAALILQRRANELENAAKRAEEERLEEERRIKKLQEEEEKRIAEEKRQKELKKEADKQAKKENKILNEKEKANERQKRLLMGQAMAVLKKVEIQPTKVDNTIIYSNDQLAKMADLKIDNTLRSPIVCVLGHVDTGKTKILDHLRCTKVQDGEAGGITQQIGATNVSAVNIQESILKTKFGKNKQLKLPGILIIDTPGHESFSNLRTRGSSLCDIAILVVDVTHGLEPQTIESIKILQNSKAPFIVALNKIDKLYEWDTRLDLEIQDSIAQLNKRTKADFDEQFSMIFSQFAEQGLNIGLFYDKEAMKMGKDIIPVVPTSAHTGEGLAELLSTICLVSQTALRKKISFKNETDALIMEAKRTQGYGMTLDIILKNGKLSTGDTVIVMENSEPVVTKIKFILVPPTMAEIRVKNAFNSVSEIHGTRAVKISLQNHDISDNIMIGMPLIAHHNPSESDIQDMISKIDLSKQLSVLKGFSDRGVHVQSSTIGSLESLLVFLRESKIAYSSVNIGDVFKKDVLKAETMVELSPMHAVILAFDVKVDKEAQEIARQVGVKIFQANIIYHLQEKFAQYVLDFRETQKKARWDDAIFPCVLHILPECIFNMKDPLVCGVGIDEGEIRTNSILRVITDKDSFVIGKVISIEKDKKSIERAVAGENVAVKIAALPGSSESSHRYYGRHFDHKSEVVSDISRKTIDVLKEFYRSEMTTDYWRLVVNLKSKLKIA